MLEFGLMDKIVFVAFVAAVIGIGLWKSRQEKQTGEDFFLAGRGLRWWLIGFSLIAANISTEQFVGMSGNAASHVGLAIASFEWMAAITLVIVAFGFLPYFLRAGIYTMPEFLEYRYNAGARNIMAIATICIYMLLVGAVTYSGALMITTLGEKMGYAISLQTGSLAIGLIAMAYVVAGGLKACAWADLIQGSALILGGACIMIYAFMELGGATEAAQIENVKTGAITIKTLAQDSGAVERFWDLNRVRMNMFLPSDDAVLPWTALMLGLWIPNFYYWGLNQYITQRTLGSASLSQGQKGIVFAAFLKLLIPFVIVVPGIIAFNLYADDMKIAAVGDNATVMAKYLKANPQTELVEVVQSPTNEQIAAWESDRFMIAVHADNDALKAIKTKSSYVLPIIQSKFDEISIKDNTIFESDDKSWKSTFPTLAAEVETYNKNVKETAETAKEKTSSEKFIAYKYDTAMGQLLGSVLPQNKGILGFVLAALLGAVVSSLAAMLNAASTIFTMDIYKKYINPKSEQKSLVLLGRICVIVFAIIAVLLAPRLGNPKINNSIFTIIQEGQGFISPGILAVFAFGLIVRKAPAISGVVGLLTSIASYGILMIAVPQLQYLNRMAVCFGLCLIIMTVMTIMNPLKQPIEFKKNTDMDLKTSKGAMLVGILVIVLTLGLYLMFSPICFAK